MGTPKGTKPWNAGKGKGWVDQRGYRWLYVDENGRKLQPWELVHHKNEDKSDNRIENLEIAEFGAHTAAHHTGTRKTQDTKRTLEAFALMRQELLRERALKSELLEALSWFINDIDGTHTRMVDFDANVELARAAIAKARGNPA